MPTRLQSERARAALDPRLSSLGDPGDFARPRAGWIRAIRDALGMPATELGRRMGITQAAVSQIERNERTGAVRVETLQRAAEALDCDFVYAFLPRRSLEEAVREQAERIASGELDRVRRSMALERQEVDIDPALREELIDQILTSKGLWTRRP